MKTLGNILWLIFGGIAGGIGCFLEGVLCCITIVGIPIGMQFFKIGKFMFWPMGKKVIETKPSGFKTFLNIVWAIFFGWEHFLSFAFVGLLFCITVVGIPFGKQYFKLAQFIILPLGHDFGVEEAAPAPAAE